MASNKNIPQKGQGTNEPDKKQPVQSDAADVDWMIISDISTRIGGSSEIKSGSDQSPAISSSQISSNQSADNDLEDLEWLRSLGLDEAIERSPSKNIASTSNSYGSLPTDNSEVDNIDWLIVTDLNTRIDDSSIKTQPANPSYQDISKSQPTLQPATVNIMDSLDVDLGLDGLDFLEDSDFSELDSLGFDTSESLSIDELENEININNTEGKIQGLAELLDDKADSSFDLSTNENDSDWDNLSGLLEDSPIAPSNDQPSLGVVSKSFEMETPISVILETTENYYEDNNLISNELVETTYQDDLLTNDLELSDAIATDEVSEDFEFPSEFGNDFQSVQDIALDGALSFEEEVEVNKLEEFNSSGLNNDFGVAQSLESLNASATEDEIWSSNSSELELKNLAESFNDAFTSDWQQITDNAKTDDAVWDNFPSIETDIVSSTSINNAFGTFDDWESEPNAAQIEERKNYDDFDLSNNSNNLDYGLENIESAFDSKKFDLKPEQSTKELQAEIGSEISNDENWNVELANDEISADLSWDAALKNEAFIETSLSDETDWSAGLEAEISNGNNVVWDEEFDDFADVPDNLNNLEQIITEQQFTDFNELDNQLNDEIASTFEGNDFDLSENYIFQSSDWDGLSESITDSDFANYADSFAVETIIDSDYADGFDNDVVPTINTDLDSSDWNVSTAEALVSDISIDAENLENMLDENFDLASFDEDNLSEIPVSDLNFGSVATTLTLNRAASAISSEDSLIPSVASSKNPFEDALGNDLLNDNDSYEEINFQEEALAHDLLNGLEPELDDFVSAKEIVAIPSPNLNLPSPSHFVAPNTSSDRDFLDDFDLDSIDPTGDEFDSGFVSKPISTGLTLPVPPIAPMPPNLPPLNRNRQEPTSPSVNNPPPFLPPLPPKRTPTQGSAAPLPPIPPHTISSGFQPQLQNRTGKKNGDNDFEQFHAQSNQTRNRKSITSIEEGWSDLLDAETVLSGGRPLDTSSTMPQSAGASISTGKASQGRERIDRNSSGISKRRDTGLPDFNDLGVEIHDANTDWSGLLDGSDLSDNVTTISRQTPQRPSEIRINPATASRSDGTSATETREIPRDRHNPKSSFGDSTQARTSPPPNQVDFNQFTEDNYDDYEDYKQSLASQPEHNPSKNKLTIPNVSLESLWQNYFKIPAIGLGAIAGVFLLYTLLNRPVFDLGLRWGLFKDARGKDFTNTDFKGAKLDNVNFSQATLTGAKMQEASLVGANFQQANLDGVNFTKANLNRARLIEASVIWAEFNNAQMNLVDLAGADLTRSNFVGAKMEGANLKSSKIGAQGTEKATKFSATTLLAWQIVNEPREGRNLNSQDLSGLNLSFTSLKRANLSNAKLNYTDMTNTDLSGANLSGAQLNGVNLSGAKLNGINFSGVVFDKNKLPKTDEETICPNGKKGPCKFQ